MKIIVTDDSKMARKMVVKVLNDVLGNEEFEIFEAENGLVCVELFQKIKPDLIFLDLTMPVMDGFDALHKIKEFDSNAKVVVVSADIQKGSMERVRDSGAFDFVKKPIDELKMRQIFNKLGKCSR